MKASDRIKTEKEMLRKRGAQPGNRNSMTNAVASAVRALQEKGKLHGRKHMAALIFIGKCSRVLANSLGYPAPDVMDFLDQRDLTDFAFLRWKIETQQAQALAKSNPRLNGEEIRADIRLCNELSSRLRKSRNDALDITPGEALRQQYPTSQNISLIPRLPEGAQDALEKGAVDMDE